MRVAIPGDHQPDLPGHEEALGGKSRFNGLDLAHALSEGARTAYAAVAKPVEGTILTVIRESAVAATSAAERDNDLETVLTATLNAAEKSVARTPTLLAILREAGVVDSGGQGLYRLFQGRCGISSGERPRGTATGRTPRGGQDVPLVPTPTRLGYETCSGPAQRRRDVDVDAIRDHSDDR